MNLIISPRKLRGTVCAISSKSQAHRLLICAAFADAPTTLICPQTNEDIEATAECLQRIGATIVRSEDIYLVTPIASIPKTAELNCRESGSTLRFMLPVVGALGIDCIFHLEGRLPARPLSPLWEEMERMGCQLTRPDDSKIRCTGKLNSGTFCIAGNISSQFITGLLFALPLMDGASHLEIKGQLESKPYVQMTLDALSLFGITIASSKIIGGQVFHSPGTVTVEGDWSNGAFFLACSKLGSNVQVENLNQSSAQGDKAVADLLITLNNHCTVDATDIPDLVPILSVVAAANEGAIFTGIQRLRLKESDRVEAIVQMLSSLGIDAQETDTTLTVYPGKFRGGTVDSLNDHRIAMSAAIAATVASGDVIILNTQCVAKSYPTFWQEYARLGGKYEQYLR